MLFFYYIEKTIDFNNKIYNISTTKKVHYSLSHNGLLKYY